MHDPFWCSSQIHAALVTRFEDVLIVRHVAIARNIG